MDDEDKNFAHTWGERHCAVTQLNKSLKDYVTRPESRKEGIHCAHAEMDVRKWSTDITRLTITIKVVLAFSFYKLN